MRSFLALFLVGSFLLAGCSGVAVVVPKTAPPQRLDEGYTAAQTRFGISLLQQLSNDEPGKNSFISPASISLILALTANGARGETQQEMLAALQFQGQSMAAVNQSNRDLLTLLANPDPRVQVEVANSLWYKQGLTLATDFRNVSKAFYNASAQPVPFGQPEAAKTINDWVSAATHGKIPTLVQGTDSLDRLYLVNALYFNGAWRYPFEPAATRDRPFTLANGRAKQVPMMELQHRLPYYQGEKFQAVSLPYGDSDRLSLYLFLPDASSSLEAFVRELTPEKWAQWMAAFKPAEGRVVLPRVKLEYAANLLPLMERLGMKRAIDGPADFTGLFAGTQEPLQISKILHKSYLEINEKGTEAAAATLVGVTATSAPRTDEPFQFVADRPFFLAIRDNQTGLILFMGGVQDPQG